MIDMWVDDLQYMTSDLQVEFIYRGAKRMLKVIELQDNQLHRLDPNTKFTFLLPVSKLKILPIIIKESALKPQGIDKAITYDQIGGLTTEIKKIKEYIQLSLFAFDKFTSRGLKAPRGILLHGPPGSSLN